jgi:hypothetical protein
MVGVVPELQFKVPKYGGRRGGGGGEAKRDGKSTTPTYGGIRARKPIFFGNPAMTTLCGVIRDQDNLKLVVLFGSD